MELTVRAFIEVAPDQFVPFAKIEANPELHRQALLLVADRIAEQVESLSGLVGTLDEVFSVARYRTEERGKFVEVPWEAEAVADAK